MYVCINVSMYVSVCVCTFKLDRHFIKAEVFYCFPLNNLKFKIDDINACLLLKETGDAVECGEL